MPLALLAVASLDVLSRLRHTFPLSHFITDLIDRPVSRLRLLYFESIREQQKAPHMQREAKKGMKI